MWGDRNKDVHLEFSQLLTMAHSAGDLKAFVHRGDVWATMKTIHGPQAAVSSYEVTLASGQGLTSQLLRVTVQSVSECMKNNELSFVVKTLPTLKEQLKIVKDCELFEREATFFTKIYPMIKNKLLVKGPIVNCYVAHNDTIILEDLSTSGFKNLNNHITDFGSIEMGMPHIKLCVRKLAQIHAASLDVEWLKVAPKYLEKDALLESGNGVLFKNFVKSANNTVIAILKEISPELVCKHSKWLLSQQCYDKLIKLTKSNPNFVNVLCHGDFWENNILFKLQPFSNKPLDVKFLDFQLFRYAPGSTDLLSLLYGSTDKKFRDQHEPEILQTYVSAFNAFACETPDRLTLDKFTEQYEFHRLFGVYNHLVYKPFNLFKDLESKEYFDTIFGDHTKLILKNFKENEKFRAEMTQIVNELVKLLDDLSLS